MSQVTINPVIGESSQNSLDKLWGDTTELEINSEE